MTVALVLIVVVVAVLLLVTVAGRRSGYSGFGGNTVVRCKQGHVFTTYWVPGVSLKAIRLGVSRFQYCPVGRHWTLVTPAREADLTEEERESAAQHHDVRVP
ncbi:MAG TPA: hypothetical protein VME22_03865 [Solirubrobacteraceae bacterium]|nr:hypothetical protein [Solirubrobacteraceae bacterium]